MPRPPPLPFVALVASPTIKNFNILDRVKRRNQNKVFNTGCFDVPWCRSVTSTAPREPRGNPEPASMARLQQAYQHQELRLHNILTYSK